MYNNYKLFKWNHDNILYTNSNNYYSDVYLHTGSIIKQQWENSVCFTYLNNKLNLISNSNHFVDYVDYGKQYNTKNKIYDNIVNNYKQVLDYNVDNDYDFDTNKVYFYMISAFCFSNSGHDLSILLDFVNYIINNKITEILIYKDYKNTNNFKLLKLIIPEECNFIELNAGHIYKIKNIIIIYPEYYNIFKHRHLISRLIDKIKNNYGSEYKDLYNKNVVLLKTNRNKNIMNSCSQIFCEDMLLELEKNDFKVLIPEEMDIFKMCIYLLFANKIVISTGSIIYTNKIFINNNAKILYIFNGNGDDSGGLKNNIKILHTDNYQFTYEKCLQFAKQILEY